MTLWHNTEPLKWLQWLSLAAQLVVRHHYPGEAHGLGENVSPQYPWKLRALVDVLMSVAQV